MRSIFLRPIQFASVAAALLVLVSVGGMGWLDWRNLGRLARIQSGVREIQTIQQTALGMQRVIAETAANRGADPFATARAHLTRLLGSDLALAPETVQDLKEAVRLFGTSDGGPAATDRGLDALRQALASETRAELALLEVIRKDARTEMRLVAAAMILIPTALGLAFWRLREHIFRPIDNLKDLLVGLADGRFQPVPVRDVDPLLLPLFDNYNRMVVRLQELEQRNREHTVGLEREVRAATHVLLQQSLTLARAERLAAVGELAAAVAHELRNPLAAVQLALANLRREMSEPTFAQRLELVGAELQRVTRLLNDLLAPSVHMPEPRRVVRLAPLVDELLQLMRYQVPPEIALEAEVPAHFECTVPTDALRQALLNLVMNAVQALGNQSGKITVGARRDAAATYVVVRDTGPGFPPTLLASGVQPFATGREGGTGLGLAIVQRLAREVHGELRLDNLAPSGARAELRIPDGFQRH